MRVLMGGRHKPSNKQLKKAAVEAGEDPDHVTNGTGHADVEAKTAPATGVEHGSKRNKTVRFARSVVTTAELLSADLIR